MGGLGEKGGDELRNKEGRSEGGGKVCFMSLLLNSLQTCFQFELFKIFAVH